MKTVLLFLFALITTTVTGQQVDRVVVNGKIIVSTEDKEGVAVYNTSSNKGTVTDKNGNFQISVAINDVVEFGALQFKDFKVSITEDVIKTKQLTVILVEEVNRLDEVVILPFGLTGDLDADLENVRTYNVDLDAIYFGLNNLTDFEFSADYKTKATNVAFNEYNPTVGHMLDIINLSGFLVSQVADISSKKKNKNKISNRAFKKALDDYSINFIHYNFKIPRNQIDAFIEYVEKEGVKEDLLKENNELLFLDRITELSRSFLKTRREKN